MNSPAPPPPGEGGAEIPASADRNEHSDASLPQDRGSVWATPLLTLPAALAALGRYRQFIVYKTVPSTRKPGKTDKLPVDWRTGQMPVKGSGGAHDPEIWLDFDMAAAQAARWGMHVGFVLTKNDPFWFVDVDGALQPDGTWNAIAQQFAQVLAGAAVEISGSGKGLHFIGSGPVPEHGTKNAALGIECYDSLRFIALTGINAAGSADWRSDERIAWIAQTYFPPVAPGAEVGDELTDTPRSDWRGPELDHDLIRRASAARSAGAVFGDRATFADLWLGDRDKLAKAFPSSSGDDYDRSSADAALAAHLAFWTGCHGTRIERLMRASALQREKWDHHATYLSLTIRNACARQTAVCQDKPVSEQAPVASATATAVESPTYLHADAQRALFAGCVYVTDAHAVLTPDGEMLRPDQFRVRFGGYTFAMDQANERTTRDAFEAFTQSQALRHPKVGTTCFKPRLPFGSILQDDGRAAVNTYAARGIAPVAGDASNFVDVMRRQYPNERDRLVLVSWIAAAVQYPGVKFQWALVLQGVHGNGKTLYVRVLRQALGARYCHELDPRKIGKDFNAFMEGRLLISVEEVNIPGARQDLLDTLKPLVTNERIEIEKKGVDQRSGEVCANWIFSTNHRNGLPALGVERRYAYLFAAQQEEGDLERDGLTPAYFKSLYDWLNAGGYAVVAHYLLNFEIPAEFNPATDCVRAPHTSSTKDAIEASRGVEEQILRDAIEAGLPGFAGEWISSLKAAHLLEGKGRRVYGVALAQLIKKLGYRPHPGLVDGRANNPVSFDGGKPRLYVLSGGSVDHATANLLPPQIADAYVRAQQSASRFPSGYASGVVVSEGNTLNTPITPTELKH